MVPGIKSQLLECNKYTQPFQMISEAHFALLQRNGNGFLHLFIFFLLLLSNRFLTFQVKMPLLGLKRELKGLNLSFACRRLDRA